jgi:predicted TIM-barrel fold metal-dependent hydrolase
VSEVSAGRATPAAAPVRWNTIDVHHHLVPPAYADTIVERNLYPLQGPLRAWTPQRSIDDMDEAGVVQAVLSVTAPGLWFGDVDLARRLARECNDYAAAMVQRYPGRFGMFAALPLPDIEASLREVAYALDELGADGIGLYTSYGDKWLGDPSFVPLFEELNRRKVLVYTHPNVPTCCANLLPDINDAHIEYQTDTTRAIANMLYSGTVSRFADLTFIWSHAGGTMPFLLDRFISTAKTPHIAARLPHGIMHELQKFFYDVAQSANPICMQSLRHIVETTQILFGTDFPFRTSLHHVEGLARSGFSEAELRCIHRENALRLLPRFRS